MHAVLDKNQGCSNQPTGCIRGVKSNSHGTIAISVIELNAQHVATCMCANVLSIPALKCKCGQESLTCKTALMSQQHV